MYRFDRVTQGILKSDTGFVHCGIFASEIHLCKARRSKRNKLKVGSPSETVAMVTILLGR